MEYPDRFRQLRSSSFKGKAVAYWMIRDKRINDNWALLRAQEVALKEKVPLVVCFQYNGEYEIINRRQYDFLFEGLIETERELQKFNIPLVLLNGPAEISVTSFIKKNFIGYMVVDYSPLKIYKARIKKVLNSTSIRIDQVDAHNIVPVWETSDKKEYAAYTIRPKIGRQLPKYLTEIPKCVRHPHAWKSSYKINWNDTDKGLNLVNNINKVSWIKPGESEAIKRLKFLNSGLKNYTSERNDPTKNALSNLSPYIHFGQISCQRIALEIQKSDLSLENKKAFLEQLIVRRELSDNFCNYEENYDQFEGFHLWAQESLNDHRNDEREYTYHIEQFEAAETHDLLWNAAQKEMTTHGKMHGYMRMYWAKKILEWTATPEIAMQNAIYLNNKYELDGRDPNGYTGIAWSIGGIHDRPWFEREIYGKIRYMNYNGCKSKFDVKRYIELNL
ncbi:MAG: deoxyribodipyrimidine photolyase [Candidatus Marinimicrobia bacterium]|nr:deoxyribodipyrimidine photolyase [Candidatus Neomarinimicrobiota bacterium]